MSLNPFFKNYRSLRKNCKGGVAVELALVVPVLLIFFAGVLSIGRVISQMAWMSQSAFQTYLIGAENSDISRRETAMYARWQILRKGNLDLALENRGARAVRTPDMAEVPTSGLNMITSRVTGDLPTILGDTSIFPLSVSITGPILAPTTAATNLAVPQNPTILWSCSGTAGTASATNCRSTCPTSDICFCPSGAGTDGIPCA